MHEEFKKSKERAARYRDNALLTHAARQFMRESALARHSYNFSWMGRMIIQYPEDLIAMQEIIWRVKPDLIIETGTAHGGSALFYASLLQLLGGGTVISIDVNLYPENKRFLTRHPLSKRMRLIRGSSTDPAVIAEVTEATHKKKRILVALDSSHSYKHVLEELTLYSPFVSKGSYIVIFDTFIEDMPPHSYPDRPWDRGSNSRTAVWEFLKQNSRFAVDEVIQQKLLITGCPDGYLKRVK